MFLASPDALPPSPTPSLQPPCAIASTAEEAEETAQGACQPIPEVLPVAESTPSAGSHLFASSVAAIAPPTHQRNTEHSSSNQSPLLKRGSRGDVVLQLQTQLQQQGYSPGSLDGIYGRRTQAAVRAFQQDQGLTVDGIVGRETWTALDQIASAPSSEPIQARPSPPEPTSPSTSPRPSPPVTVVPSEDSLHPDISEPEPIPFTWAWIAGWIFLYGSGWVWIIYDARQKSHPPIAESSHRKAATPVTNGELEEKTVASQSVPQHEAVAIATPRPLKPKPAPQAISSPPSSSASEEMATPTESSQSPTTLAAKAEPTPTTLEANNVHQSLSEEAAQPIPYADPTELAPFAQLFDDWSGADETLYEDEKVIARLPDPATDLEEPPFQYSLVDWAEDLFVLRGNELRVLKSRLARYGNRINKVITIRRTTINGAYEDKSFHLTLG